MDFNYKNPAHLFAFLMIMASLLMFIIVPILSYFGIFAADATGPIENIPSDFKLFFELFVLILQGIFVIVLLILSPYVWYTLVNKLSWKQMLERIHLHTKQLDMALLWGIITAIAAFVFVIVLGVLLSVLGFNVKEASNIKDLELFFSTPSILFLITLQPIAEEFFFRGFLLEKFSSLQGELFGVFLSSLFFGMAHLSYGNLYPALMTGCIGVLLAFLVVKTKNLTAAIIAHVLFNVTSFVFYLIGRELLVEALML